MYSPEIDEEEKRIIADAFQQTTIFSKIERKGVIGGAFDIEIVINIIGNIVASVLYDLIKKLFTRNKEKIMDKNSRPKYTMLVLRTANKFVIVSNVNDKNELRIRKASAYGKHVTNIEDIYSDEKLSEYMQD